MPRNAALPTVSTIGLRSGCDKRKCVPTKTAAAAAIVPRPSTVVKLLDQVPLRPQHCQWNAEGYLAQPHACKLLDRGQPDHRERRHEEMKSRPVRCRAGCSLPERRVLPELRHEHTSARLTSGASANGGDSRMLPFKMRRRNGEEGSRAAGRLQNS